MPLIIVSRVNGREQMERKEGHRLAIWNETISLWCNRIAEPTVGCERGYQPT
jgi:hypothetical protein